MSEPVKEPSHILPKALNKLWGSNKVGLAAWATTIYGVTSLGAPVALRITSAACICVIVTAVILGNAIEDYAAKRDKPAA